MEELATRESSKIQFVVEINYDLYTENFRDEVFESVKNFVKDYYGTISAVTPETDRIEVIDESNESDLNIGLSMENLTDGATLSIFVKSV